jgi:hypothetical protein
MTPRLSLSIPSVWSHMRTLRSGAAEVLADLDPDFRAATVMTACELAENAVKYGGEAPDAGGARLVIDVDERAVAIRVTSGISDSNALSELAICIQRITAAVDLESLYIQRLEELMEQPGQYSRLGLIRVAFEGRFDLSLRIDGATVTVIATRAR